MKLPEEFENKLKNLLGEDEFSEYKNVLDDERFYGFRANTLKISFDEFKKIACESLGAYANVPWCSDGLYYKDSFPGRHPYYHAGLYYIQEPSAMYPGASLKPEPGERVLDICAAPGGKTVQLASAMKGEGILVSNDISEERVKALVKNVELTGAKNVIITNETPENLSKNFEGWFDKILVDAPCSGEGMFRKDEEAVKSWENFKTEKCRGMQDSILESVHKMLKPGGILLYSTCTFSPLENEQTISDFMDRYGCYETLPLEKCGGICDANPAWCENGVSNCIENAARLWPHKIKGEGHFTALLRKKTAEETEGMGGLEDDCADGINGGFPKSRRAEKKKKDKPRSFRKIQGTPDSVSVFYKKYMRSVPNDGCYFIMGTNLYYLPEEPPMLDGLKIARAGVYMGSVEYESFKPSHPFAMTLTASDFKTVIDMTACGESIQRYLKGETLSNVGDDCKVYRNGEICGLYDLPDGYAAICVDMHIVGLGRIQGGCIKNLYPKGWRRMR
ncbi:MAG: RsmB/NOP family class I SAM-dependent RNA methyltransferase [Clostridia bacterium]|nr:RsmB/NOP family class I SAM-dependent RNA methyltransferase [Clostridia bacterium]